MAATPLTVPSAALHLNAIAGSAPPSGLRLTRFRTGCPNAGCPLSAKASAPPSRLAASSSLTRGLTYGGSSGDERLGDVELGPKVKPTADEVFAG
ncbi:hypothetical protein BD309DRAFT_1024741 [Dichomitus squalens]|nr:hypothetical protein BD309DRAFT_1024741 [Dichomitus squalens]